MYVILFCWLFYSLSAPWYCWLILALDVILKWWMCRERDYRRSPTADVYPTEDGKFLGVYGEEEEIFDTFEQASEWALSKFREKHNK